MSTILSSVTIAEKTTFFKASFVFSTAFKANWLVENCGIVLVLSQKNGATKDVLQVAEVKIN